MAITPAAFRRVRARLGGTVQGVGFRPYVYQLAANLNLFSGFVLEHGGAVLPGRQRKLRCTDVLRA